MPHPNNFNSKQAKCILFQIFQQQKNGQQLCQKTKKRESVQNFYQRRCPWYITRPYTCSERCMPAICQLTGNFAQRVQVCMFDNYATMPNCNFKNYATMPNCMFDNYATMQLCPTCTTCTTLYVQRLCSENFDANQYKESKHMSTKQAHKAR